MIILGGGMAGCMAGLLLPGSRVLEGRSEPKEHNALLRFPTDDISEALGIPFKKVHMQKSIWHGGAYHPPSPQMTNLYSKKVTDHYRRRSIADISDGVRYIAPSHFHQLMIKMLGDRIEFNADINRALSNTNKTIISTLPIYINADLLSAKCPIGNFEDIKIFVTHIKIKNCDTNCTVYIPGNNTGLYRASITGDLLIAESIKPHLTASDLERLKDSLGLIPSDMEIIFESKAQSNGKIIPMDETLRKQFLYDITTRHNFYSLGRLATWRNLLLDDVLHDINVIKRMMATSSYENRKGMY